MIGWGGKKGVKKKLLPDLDDFSTSSIRREVRNESLFHPMALYPMAMGALSGLAAFLYEVPMFFAGMGGLMAIGATTSIINYFFRDDIISKKYLDSLSRTFARKREQILQTLGEDLEHCRSIPGAERYASQGVKQYVSIEKKYKKLNMLLNQKFSDTELTHGSYLGAAEQVYFSVLDNLMKIVSLLQGASAIDLQYIHQRRKELQKLQHVDSADEREFETLKKREKLRKSHLKEVNRLLTANEESMTTMDETSGAIAVLQTNNGLADVDMETAMSHLKELAGRVSSYEKIQGKENTKQNITESQRSVTTQQ